MSDRGKFAGGAVLYAIDLHRLVDFYSAVAGFERQDGSDSHATLRAWGMELVIQQIPADIASSITTNAPPELRVTAAAKLVFRVDDIDAARAQASQHGGQIHAVDAQWEFNGMRVCDGHDPEGNIFQLRQPIS